MKLIKTDKAATHCVILRNDFANIGKWVLFAGEDDAEVFARDNCGRVVDQDGLEEKYESMHCAEGRDPRQTYSGRCIEDPDQAEEIWAAEYAEAAADTFRNEDVYEIVDEACEA